MVKSYHWLICVLLFAFTTNQARSKDPLFQTAQNYHEKISYQKSIAQPRTKKDSLLQAVQEYHENLNGPKIPSQIRINYNLDRFSKYIKEAAGEIIPASKHIAKKVDSKNKKPLFFIKKLQYIAPKTNGNYDLSDFTGYVAFTMLLDDEKLEFESEEYIETYPLVAFNFMDESRLNEIFDAESLIEFLESLSKHIENTERSKRYDIIHEPLTVWDSWHTESTCPAAYIEWPNYVYAKFIGGGIGKLADSIFHQSDYTNRVKQLARIIGFFSCYESNFPSTKSSIDFWGYYFDKDVAMRRIEKGDQPVYEDGEEPLVHEHSADHTFLTMLFKKINAENPELTEEVLNSLSPAYAESYYYLCRKWIEDNSVFPDKEIIQLVIMLLETKFDYFEKLY